MIFSGDWFCYFLVQQELKKTCRVVGVEIHLLIESMNVYAQKYNNIMARYITYFSAIVMQE